MKRMMSFLLICMLLFLSSCTSAPTNESVENQTTVSAGSVIYFYDQAVEETDVGTVAKIYRLDDAEQEKLQKLLDGQNWISDALVDRVEFYFDAHMPYGDRLLYFGYENNVAYYDGYFCESTALLSFVQKLHEKAEQFGL